jgi:hypothetical protein
MPRIPGDAPQDITPVLPQATRPLASYQGGVAQRAGVALGETEAQAGQEGFRSAVEVQNAQDRIAMAHGMQDFLAKKLQIEQQIENDPDYQTAPQRYQQALTRAAQDSGAEIRSPVMRAEFQSGLSHFMNYGVESVLRQSHDRAVQADRLWLDGHVDQGVDLALRSGDEQAAMGALASASNAIDAMSQKGSITAAEARARHLEITDKYSTARARMMIEANPAEAARLLAPDQAAPGSTSPATGLGRTAAALPTFSPTGDWRDHIPADKRMELYRTAQAEDLRLDAQRERVRRDAAETSMNRIVTQLITDPTKVSVATIANDPNLRASEKLELYRITQAALNKDIDARDTKTYGSGFYGLYQRIHAPDGDPSKLTDPAELYSHVGQNGDLTVSGVDKLTAEIQSRRTPEGEAEAEMRKAFLSNARGEISGTNEGIHLRDPKGDELYLKFLAQALPAYDAGRKAGKSPAQLLNPDSPDYVGKSIQQFHRTPAQRMADLIAGGEGPPEPVPRGGMDLSTPEGLRAAVRAGQITREQGVNIGIQNGWVRPNAPPPGPPSPPIAQ